MYVSVHICFVWQVFGATNVELVTKTRMEHLTDMDKEKTKKQSKHPLESFLGIAEQEEKAQAPEGAMAANGVGIIWIYDLLNYTFV